MTVEGVWPRVDAASPLHGAPLVSAPESAGVASLPDLYVCFLNVNGG